jgi:uncharacterized membrane protein YecN with MAPEG domain
MITALYAIPLALLFLILTARVITYRRDNQIGLGDDGDKSLMKRMRAQANFTETVPFSLVLMLLVEFQFPSLWVVNLIGATLVLGRIAHGIGFSTSPPRMNLRVGGMVLTLVSVIISIIALILKSLNDVIFASFLQVGKKSHLCGIFLLRGGMGLCRSPTRIGCGRSSGVEHNLAKVRVGRSNRLARSNSILHAPQEAQAVQGISLGGLFAF